MKTEEKYILEGVFTEFGKKEEPRILKTVKIKGRKAIPNYSSINRMCLYKLGDNYTEDEYNREFILKMKKANESIKEFICGNISDSSLILILSVEETFDEYTLNGMFEL